MLLYLAGRHIANYDVLIYYKSCNLFFSQCLDREDPSSMGRMTLYPLAYDDGGRGHPATTTVNVVIEDVNDNHPYILYPVSINYFFIEKNTVNSAYKVHHWAFNKRIKT